jgi:hypothetical protein
MCLPGAARKHNGGAALIPRKAHLNPGHKYDPILTSSPPPHHLNRKTGFCNHCAVCTCTRSPTTFQLLIFTYFHDTWLGGLPSLIPFNLL